MLRPQLPRLSADEYQAEFQFCADNGLELEVAADYGWVIRGANGDNYGHVVGCIDQLRDSVELLRLDGGFHWSTFTTLHDALDNLVVKLQHDSSDNGPRRYRLPVRLQAAAVRA